MRLAKSQPKLRSFLMIVRKHYLMIEHLYKKLTRIHSTRREGTVKLANLKTSQIKMNLKSKLNLKEAQKD
jgi:hypothetical protein